MKINISVEKNTFDMKKIIHTSIFFAILSFFLMSCENDIDNYDAPNGGIRGTIFDATTNEPIPLPVQGETGIMINLFEQNTGATEAVNFRAKQDGTYQHSKVFNCEYKVVVDGPFVDKCEGIVTVKGQTQFDLSATPYSRINASATVASDNKVTINYSAITTDASFTIDEVSLMWNFAPGVDVHGSNYAKRENTNVNAGHFVYDLPNDNQFKENHYKIQANKNRIYLRVAAKVNGVTNYSKTIEVVINDIRS